MINHWIASNFILVVILIAVILWTLTKGGFQGLKSPIFIGAPGFSMGTDRALRSESTSPS